MAEDSRGKAGEKMNSTTINFPDDFVKSIKELNEMCLQQENIAASMLYRLMFRHECNLSILDYYADKILDALVGFGGEYAEEDYRNYLEYLKRVIPSVYTSYREMFEENLQDFHNE